MQVDQREALDDPRPIVGVMAHAYACPLIRSRASSSESNRETGPEAAGDGESHHAAAPAAGGLPDGQEAAVAAANELVIDALLAAYAETIGPDVRFLGLPQGTSTFPPKKPEGGAWRGADGLRVVDSELPRGLVKRGWLHKHTRDLPGSVVYLASVDVAAPAEDWAKTEDGIVDDLRGVVSSLASREIKVLLVLVRAGAGAGQTGGKEERELTDERASNIRRRAEIDTRMVVMVGEPDLAYHNSPASVRRIAKAARDMAIAHYAAHISRLRRWEKVLVPTQRLYRPLLTRLYFKLGVLHEMQGLIDRSVLCYQEVSALLSDMVPRDGQDFVGSGGGGDTGGMPSRDPMGAAACVVGGADAMEQIRGVAEVVHLRLVRNHLHRNMSVEGAIRQLRRHVAAFGRSVSANGFGRKPPRRRVSESGGSKGPTEGGRDSLDVARTVPYRHHAWLSRQYLSFGEMLGEHLSQFPLSRIRGDGGGLGYTSPGYYYLNAALQAVRRRKTFERLLNETSEAELRSSIEGLESREALYMGESVRLVDPDNPDRDLRRQCRAFLDLEEAKTDGAEVARSLLLKALEHCPSDSGAFLRRRVLVLSHLGEESLVAERHEEALDRLPTVWKTYLDDGWLQLAVATLRRVYTCAWKAGKARTAADAALRLAGKALWPWIPEEERKRLLADALPLLGAIPRQSPAVGGGGKDVNGGNNFVASVPPEGSASERYEATVDASRLVLKLSSRFSMPEASAGDEVSMRLGLLSLLPLDTRLETLELSFNHPSFDCVVRDSDASSRAKESDFATPPATEAAADGHDRTADLTLSANALLRVNVDLCVPWEAMPSKEPLRLVGAKALMRERGGSGVDGALAGISLSITAGTSQDISHEVGGESWAAISGFESVLLVAPRARAHVRVVDPPTVLLGLVTRISVTVSASPDADESGGIGGGGASGRCCEAPHPFRGGFLHLECEPAPVPPPPVMELTSSSIPGLGDGSSDFSAASALAAPVAASDKGTAGGAPPSSVPASPSTLATTASRSSSSPSIPARPKPERAFFWTPSSSAADYAGQDESDESGAVHGFLPIVVGSDGQPVEGMPLPVPAEGVGEVTIPVWVRSVTAGKVALRARVVYGLEGKPLESGAVAEAGGVTAAAMVTAEGVAATEWARAEVLCVRPLATMVDVVSLQADDTRHPGPSHERPGHTVAVKVSVTNLQDRRIAISRMEVVPPSPSPPASASGSSSTSPNPSAASSPPPYNSPPLPNTANFATVANSIGGSAGVENADTGMSWAGLTNGPVLHDENAPVSSTGTKGEDSTTAAAAVAKVVALPGTGDSYTCCFTARGFAERPAPLGKLRVTWRPESTSTSKMAMTAGGDSGLASPSGTKRDSEEGYSLGDGLEPQTFTDFSLPVLSPRPPALSARLDAPPHARVGVEFALSWEISNLTPAYSSMRLTSEEGKEFVWSGKRQCSLQVAPFETVSIMYRLVPLVPGHVLLPKVAVISDREQIDIVQDSMEGRPHIFVRP